MFFFSKSSKKKRTGRLHHSRRPFEWMQALEPRTLMSTVTWTGGGADTNFGTAGNWGGTVPGAGDTAVINMAVTRITVAADQTVGGLKVLANVAFTVSSGKTLTVASSGALTGTVEVTHGGIMGVGGNLVADNLVVGTDATNNSALILDGAVVAVKGNTVIGQSATGNDMEITASTFTTYKLQLGTAAGVDGTIDVNGMISVGVPSALVVAKGANATPGGVEVGIAGSGVINVSAGADANFNDSPVTLGESGTGQGIILVTGHETVSPLSLAKVSSVENSGTFYVGEGNLGSLQVYDHAQAVIGDTILGKNADASGFVKVQTAAAATGLAASRIIFGALTVGDQGKADILVTDASTIESVTAGIATGTIDTTVKQVTVKIVSGGKWTVIGGDFKIAPKLSPAAGADKVKVILKDATGKGTIAATASFLKKGVATIEGGTILSADADSRNDAGKGKSTDIVPGSDDSSDPDSVYYGTMTLGSTGDSVYTSLDSSAGVLLRVNVGYSSGTWQHSELDVAGSVTLPSDGGSGDYAAELYVVAGSSLSGIPVGTSFTLVSSAGVSGYFKDLPAGIYTSDSPTGSNANPMPGSYLPSLPSGMGWKISYSGGSVTLTVVDRLYNVTFTMDTDYGWYSEFGTHTFAGDLAHLYAGVYSHDITYGETGEYSLQFSGNWFLKEEVDPVEAAYWNGDSSTLPPTSPDGWTLNSEWIDTSISGATYLTITSWSWNKNDWTADGLTSAL